jgi:hypothetical protein
MDRDRFESALDRLIAAHDRKVCAEIDAAACRTSWDFHKMHQAAGAFAEARDTFLDEVFAPPPPSPPPVPLIVPWEEQVRGRTRGRPILWRRGIEIRIPWRGVLYTFAADADFLIVDGGAEEIKSPDFLPLEGGHTIRFRGVDYESREDGPPELTELALEACRAVALCLDAAGVSSSAMTRPWPSDKPTFADIVKGSTSVDVAA